MWVNENECQTRQKSLREQTQSKSLESWSPFCGTNKHNTHTKKLLSMTHTLLKSNYTTCIWSEWTDQGPIAPSRGSIPENCILNFQTEHLYDMWIVTLFPTGHLENSTNSTSRGEACDSNVEGSWDAHPWRWSLIGRPSGPDTHHPIIQKLL